MQNLMKKQVCTQLHEQLENVYKNHRLIVKPEKHLELKTFLLQARKRIV